MEVVSHEGEVAHFKFNDQQRVILLGILKTKDSSAKHIKEKANQLIKETESNIAFWLHAHLASLEKIDPNNPIHLRLKNFTNSLSEQDSVKRLNEIIDKAKDLKTIFNNNIHIYSFHLRGQISSYLMKDETLSELVLKYKDREAIPTYVSQIRAVERLFNHLLGILINSASDIRPWHQVPLPTDYKKDYSSLIFSLAGSYHRVYGKQPAPSPKSKFVNYVTSISDLLSLGIGTRVIGKMTNIYLAKPKSYE